MKENTKANAGENRKESKTEVRADYKRPEVKSYSQAELAEKQLTVYAGSLIQP
jgi:hypothetical protein